MKHKIGDLVACRVKSEFLKHSHAIGIIVHKKKNFCVIEWMDTASKSECSENTIQEMKDLLEKIMSGEENVICNSKDRITI